jgi:hypothetical protein
MPIGWVEIVSLIFYIAIITLVVWLIRWMIGIREDVAGIRRQLEKRAAMDDQDRTEETAMLDDSFYTDQELAGLNEWIQIENDRLPQDPFTFWFIKLKSSSPELIDLVMEPLATLLGNRSLPALPGVTEESRITTTLFRHDRGLKARLMYFKAAVDSQDGSVSMTGHKATD